MPFNFRSEPCETIDPLQAFAAAESAPRFYWEQPAAGRFRVGIGAAARVTVAGADRFRAAETRARELFAQLSWEGSEWVGRWTPWDTVWVACAASLPAIAFLAFVSRARAAAWWPLGLHREAYAIGAGAPLVGLLAIWFLAVNAWSSGAASPLPYFPLANPLDVTLGLALAVLFVWSGRHGGISERARYGGLGVGVFVALNGIVMRTGHHWLDIPWRLSSLLASKPLQAALTLAWTVTGVALMVGATRRGLRPLWMVGAGLLAVVVAKLFAIDLAALSGLPRVVAFLGVGALLLLIGYLSPLPPAEPRPPAGPADPSPG